MYLMSWRIIVQFFDEMLKKTGFLKIKNMHRPICRLFIWFARCQSISVSGGNELGWKTGTSPNCQRKKTLWSFDKWSDKWIGINEDKSSRITGREQCFAWSWKNGWYEKNIQPPILNLRIWMFTKFLTSFLQVMYFLLFFSSKTIELVKSHSFGIGFWTQWSRYLCRIGLF